MRLLGRRWSAGWDVFAPGVARGLGVTALIAALALTIVACSGGSNSSAVSTSTPAPTPVATSGSDSGTAGATGSSGAQVTSPTGTAGNQFSHLADLAGLKSFRWDITLSGTGSFLANAGNPSIPGADSSKFSATGAYIAPDQAQVSVNAGGLEYKQTVKGAQQWTTVGGVTTGPTAATSDAASLIYVTAFVDPQSVVDKASIKCGGTETVNGVQATRCETTDALNQQLVAGFAGSGAETTDASFVLWVARDGNYVVRWEFNAQGTSEGQPFQWSFVANITDVNNVSSIQP